MTAQPEHPAPFTPGILEGAVERGWITPGRWIDPYGGSGGAFLLEELVAGVDVTCIEIEPAFCARWPRLTLGDSTALQFDDDTFSGAVTSPPYAGVRFADYNRPKAPLSTKGRRGYDLSAKYLTGDPTYTLQPNNSAAYVKASGTKDGYWEISERVWYELARVLKLGSPFVFNYKPTVNAPDSFDDHLKLLLQAGFTPVDMFYVATRGYGFGTGGQKRDPLGERVVLLRLDDGYPPADVIDSLVAACPQAEGFA